MLLRSIRYLTPPTGLRRVTAAETTRSQKKALPALGLASLASPNNCSQLACAQVAAGLPLAIAIAIHNIPEGLAIAMPIFYATHSRWRAIGLGTLSVRSKRACTWKGGMF